MNESCGVEIYWEAFQHPFFGGRPLYLAATRRGLCRLTLPNESFDALRTWAARKIPDAALIHDPGKLAGYAGQLQEYVDGGRTVFALPMDLHGTPFQISVWRAVSCIPYGRTSSYSEIAEAVGAPAAVRAVGAANGANPVPIVIPCHRVIGKNAALTGFRGGLRMKRRLLEREGVYG